MPTRPATMDDIRAIVKRSTYPAGNCIVRDVGREVVAALRDGIDDPPARPMTIDEMCDRVSKSRGYSSNEWASGFCNAVEKVRKLAQEQPPDPRDEFIKSMSVMFTGIDAGTTLDGILTNAHDAFQRLTAERDQLRSQLAAQGQADTHERRMAWLRGVAKNIPNDPFGYGTYQVGVDAVLREAAKA